MLPMYGIITYYAPYHLSYATGGLYLSFAFMKYIKSRHLFWFELYNYVLVSGLDAGVAFSGIIIFFAVQYHDKTLNWWGNSVSSAGLGRAYLVPVLLPIRTGVLWTVSGHLRLWLHLASIWD